MDAVREAFRAVPRRGFLLLGQRPDHDGPHPIGYGQTNSQPRTVEGMLRLLDVRPGAKVLDVGSGSGWTTALLAHLVGPTGVVLGVELVAQLVEFGAANLAATKQPWATIRAADPHHLGLPGDAPFDRILVSAEAGELPGELLDQLAPDARMVVPVAGEMTLAVKAGGTVQLSRHGHYLFVPLIGGSADTEQS